jgi:hypothetical protein
VFSAVQKDLIGADAFKLQIEGSSPLWKSPDPESGAIVPFALTEEFLGFEKPGGYANGSWAVNTE